MLRIAEAVQHQRHRSPAGGQRGLVLRPRAAVRGRRRDGRRAGRRGRLADRGRGLRGRRPDDVDAARGAAAPDRPGGQPRDLRARPGRLVALGDGDDADRGARPRRRDQLRPRRRQPRLRLREGKLKQITNDHSLVEELRRQGKLTRDQAAEHPQRSVITRALGPEPDVEVDTMTFRARPGDLFLLCSDGLTTMLSDDEMLAILIASIVCERTARRLVRAANDRGGRDNITVVLFRLESADSEAPEEGATLVGASRRGRGPDRRRRPRRESPRSAPPSRRAAAGSPSRSSPARTPRRRWPRAAAQGRRPAARRSRAIGVGAVLGARQVWFLGTDDDGRIALYRGLPYDLPFGIELYSRGLLDPDHARGAAGGPPRRRHRPRAALPRTTPSRWSTTSRTAADEAAPPPSSQPAAAPGAAPAARAAAAAAAERRRPRRRGGRGQPVERPQPRAVRPDPGRRPADRRLRLGLRRPRRPRSGTCR